MKELLIDARWLTTGIGTYTSNLLREYAATTNLELHAITLPQHRDTVTPYCRRVTVVDASMYSLKEQFVIPRAARNNGVLHVPHYNVPLLYGGTLLTSILDLTHILDGTFRKTLKSRLYANPMFHLAARKSAHIFTLSEYSKRMIEEHLKTPEDKVTVTYCGVGPQFFPMNREEAREAVRREIGVGRPYILYVGNLKPHKNLNGLMRAFASSESTKRACDLLVIGEDPAGEASLRSLFHKLRISESVRIVARVSEETLRSAYSAAELTVLPSFEEGFGLPLVESMACGTPVACSNAASLPEVAGDAAEYFDPSDVSAIAAALERILQSRSHWETLQQRGLRQARKFTWSECARKHYEVYREYLCN